MQEIISLIDVSGSMQKVKDDALTGFNSFLEEQKKLGEANLTVIMFDNHFEIHYEGKLSEASPLMRWPNGGSTALLDAVGRIFDHTRERFTREKPEKVVLAIQTDGEENSSRIFTREQVAAMIKEHQEKYGWTVIFMGADPDAWQTTQTASSLNITPKNTINYAAAEPGKGFAEYSNSVIRARTE